MKVVDSVESDEAAGIHCDLNRWLLERSAERLKAGILHAEKQSKARS